MLHQDAQAQGLAMSCLVPILKIIEATVSEQMQAHVSHQIRIFCLTKAVLLTPESISEL